jgi:hypothetical protein
MTGVPQRERLAKLTLVSQLPLNAILQTLRGEDILGERKLVELLSAENSTFGVVRWKEEGRRKKEEGRRKKEEGRR